MAKQERKKEDTPVEIPSPPNELYEKAQDIYDELYNLLIEEDRGKEKYRFTVAIAANSLYFYKKALKLFDANDNDFSSPQTMNQAIAAVNKASGEYFRAAKSLLLTPESELKLDLIDEEEEKGESFFDLLNKTKSGNENKSQREEQSPKNREKQGRKTK